MEVVVASLLFLSERQAEFKGPMLSLRLPNTPIRNAPSQCKCLVLFSKKYRRTNVMNAIHPRRLLRRFCASSVSGSTLFKRSVTVKAPQSQASADQLLSLTSETLNDYKVALPPNEAQLRYAHLYFAATSPTLLYTAAHFRDLPPSPFPEVAFLGRSNVGKSSLLNALFGRTRARDARVSKRPGMTKTMNGFGVPGPNNPLGAASKDKSQETPMWKRFPRYGGLVVVDMPGYGAGSRADWGKEALKFLENRKQLRRTFVLVDTEHGLKSSDAELLTHLRASGVPFQVILSKVDKLIYPKPKPPGPIGISNRLKQLEKVREEVRGQINMAAGDKRDGVGDILCCSAEKSLTAPHQRLGIDQVRWTVLNACGVECDIYGQKKRSISARDVRLQSEVE